MIEGLKHLLQRFDAYLFEYFNAFSNNGNTSVMVFFSFFASHSFLIPANIIFASYLLFIKKDRWSCIKLLSISISSYLVMSGLKLYFHRVRPMHPVHDTALGFSFPSGHAMSSVTFYGLLIYFVSAEVKEPVLKWLLIVLFAAMIVTIGFSRVYLRVHFGSDVLAGYFFGLIWLTLSLIILNKIQQKKPYENSI
ncbi:MAG: phosphatase PAP2 family protein [Flavitalea sp.]